MQITEPPSQQKAVALFSLGFRPFFLVAGLSAFLLMAYWLHVFSAGLVVSDQIAPVYWHSHEMIFAYTAAVIAGFLLTAVKNWTGVQTLKGTWLAALFLIWLLPRLMFVLNVDVFWLAVVDLLFLPLLAIAIACPILKARQWNNLFFVSLILIFAASHLVFYLQFLAGLDAGEEWGVHTALGVVLIIITVMAGRVIGFFIERGINENVKSFRWANQLALWATVAFVALQFVLPKSWLTMIVVLAMLGHLGRLVGWHHQQLWRVPLLWILYLGYIWLTLGFALTALELNGLVAETLAIHMFTVGAIGVITLGMMARVALGHTGRAMQQHKLVTLAFVVINIAVILRVFAPLLWPQLHLLWVQLAGASWILAFLCFSLVYLPILWFSRVDGRPG